MGWSTSERCRTGMDCLALSRFAHTRTGDMPFAGCSAQSESATLIRPVGGLALAAELSEAQSLPSKIRASPPTRHVPATEGPTLAYALTSRMDCLAPRHTRRPKGVVSRCREGGRRDVTLFITLTWRTLPHFVVTQFITHLIGHYPIQPEVFFHIAFLPRPRHSTWLFCRNPLRTCRIIS